MRNVYTILSAGILLALTWASCKKMNSTYDQYVVTGGVTYSGKITSPVVYAGKNRVKIAWLRGADPNVVKAKIYWDNAQDSTEVMIPATGDTISAIIGNLEERQYTFVVKTYDKNGNASIPVELTGESFGSKYQAYLLQRSVVSGEDTGKTLLINWGNANTSGGAYATDVTYTDSNNVQKRRRFLTTESFSAMTDYKAGTNYKYTTVYLPRALCMDTFFTPASTEYVAARIRKDTTGNAVTTDSYAATSQLANGGGPARFAYDDQLNTFWHTHHTPAPVPGYPHWLAVDLKKTYYVTRAELTCRPNVTNSFTAFTIQGSANGTTWTDYGSFTLIQKNPTQSFILTSVARMRYFRIYATAGPNAYANLADFTVIGYEK